MFNLNKKPLLQLAVSGISSQIMAAMILFVSAGTFNFPAAWVLLTVLSVISLAFIFWLYSRNTNQIYNRLRLQKRDNAQSYLIIAIVITIFTSLFISGLDRRFGWFSFPVWRYVLSGVLLLAAILIYIDVFKNNPFLSNTLEINKKQSIVTKGLYSVVRHPMYLAALLACAACMLILGSLLNIPLFIIIVCLVNIRIVCEEKQLLKAFPQEYAHYSSKVQHKLIPVNIFRMFRKSNIE